MSDVSCRAFAFFRALARDGYFELDALYERTRIPREVLNDPGAFAAWDDWVDMIGHVSELTGLRGPELAKTGYAIMEPAFTGPLLGTVGLVADCHDLYRIAATWFGPSVFRSLRFAYTRVSARELEFEVTIPPDRVDSPEWFWMAAGAMRCVPRFLGHRQDAEVTSTVTSRRMHLSIVVPESRTLWARLKRLGSLWRGHADVLNELTTQQQRLIASKTALEESQRATRLLLQALPDAVLHLARDGRVQSVELGGASRDLELMRDWRARNVSELALVTPGLSQDAVAELVATLTAAIESGVERSITVTLRDMGRERILDWRFMPSGSVGGEVIALVRDVTQARALERQLAVTERMATVGTLAAGIAHDLNNPLTYVAANLELAREAVVRLERGDLSCVPELLPMVNDALAGALRAQQLVADLKVFTRVERRHEPQPVDLVSLVDSAVKLTASAVRQRGEVTLEVKEPIHVLGDGGRLSQVIVNLLVNASQALPTDQDRVRRIVVRVRRDDTRRAIVEVQDTGVGMTPEVRARLFEPFFTTKSVGEGTGLGLSICQRIIDEHDGTIEVDSEPGRGSTFRVVFPAARVVEPTALAPRSSSSAETPRVGGRRLDVLIVDDEPLVGRALARALRDHATEVVSSGREALARLARKRFDVVLCDVMMPEMTGLELYERVRSESSAQGERFLFVSGGVLNQAAEQLVAAHAHRTLSKPVRQTELLKAVEAIARGEPTPGDQLMNLSVS